MGEFYSSKNVQSDSSSLRIWQILCIVFAILALAFLIALIVVLATQEDEVESCPSPAAKTSAQTSSPGKASIFNDLTSDELKAVRDFIERKSELNITKFSKATINSNYIFLIELYVPGKDQALAYLDGSSAKPERKARVVVHAGGKIPAQVEEYLVSPAGSPKTYERITYKALGVGSIIPFSGRASNSIENKALDALLKRELKPAETLLRRRYNDFSFTDCGKKCLRYCVSAPRHTEKAGERKVWVWFTYGLIGKVLFPVDFQLDIDISSTDPVYWIIDKIILVYSEYPTITTLLEEYTSTAKFPLPQNWDDPEKLFSTFYPKGSPPVYFDSVAEGPQMYEPAGNRFKVEGRHVTYMDWAMDLRYRSSSGMQIFDINYRKKRIVYELSLQEAASTYSAKQPGLETAMFLDSGYAVGASYHEMVVGFDCPATAVFLDVVVLVDSTDPKVKKNAICVFEWSTGMPLRRHFQQNTGDDKTFYGAMENYALVVRTVTTVFNNDYIFDYLFYLNGMIEVKVSTTGYLLTAHYRDSDKQYGYQVHEGLSGLVYDQYVNYKVDLDVDGRSNSLEKVTVSSSSASDYRIRNVVKNIIQTATIISELNGRISINDLHKPMYVNIFNEDKKNQMGVKKGFRIQLASPVLDVYNSYNDEFDKMMPWAKYPVTVSVYKEDERRSSSIYNQNSALKPAVNFLNFLTDNEDLIKKDLVAWVTLRLLHIPSSEDVPFVTTQGSHAHFFVRPFNYFDLDPSMNSRNVIIMEPGKVKKYTKEHEECVPTKPESDYSEM